MSRPFCDTLCPFSFIKQSEVPGFSKYPFDIPVHNLETIDFHPAVTFFVGDNGTGKSTLLKAIAVACQFETEGGTPNFNFGTRESRLAAAPPHRRDARDAPPPRRLLPPRRKFLQRRHRNRKP